MYGNNPGGYGSGYGGNYGAPPPQSPQYGDRQIYCGENREPALVLIFSILTCGIYYFYWVYKVSEETQRFLDEPDTSPMVEVLLTLFTCGIYNIYWDYKMGRKLMRMQMKVGLPPSDNAWMYVILDLVQIGFINGMIQQGHLNEIWHRARQGNGYNR